jgi:hypothetical protein
MQCSHSRRGGSGFKLNVQDLSSLTLNLGPHTTAPLASLGVSVDYSPFYQVNVSEGANVIPLSASSSSEKRAKTSSTVVRINVEGWQNNRMNLDSISMNKVGAWGISLQERDTETRYTGSEAAAVPAFKTRFPVHR